MSPQVYAIGVAGMLAIAGIGGYLHERDKRVRTEALAEARVDSITRAVRADSVEMAYRDSVADERLEQADDDRAEAERRAEQAERRAQRAAQDRDSLVAAVMEAPDTTALRARVRDLQASHEEEVSALRESNASLRDALAAADSATAVWRERATDRAAQVQSLQAAVRDLTEMQGQDSGRGFVETWGERLAYTAGGVVVGYLAAGG